MAAGSTYTPLATTTVSGSSTYIISFTFISSSYTDLVLIGEVAPQSEITAFGFRFNGDSSSLYSYLQMSGNGGSEASTLDTNQTKGLISGALMNTTTRSIFKMNR